MIRPTLTLLSLFLLTAWNQSLAADLDGRPNVIIFIADDVSWNDYGCYGNPAARTPHIDALAKNGIRFDQAYLTASSCSPSRSSIITGRYPHNNGKAAELHQPISWNLPWFPELLRDAGYYTAISGKHHMTSTKGPQGETRPEPFDLVDGGRAAGNSGGHANWVKTTRERPQDKPFFFWFAAYDAHRGWDGDKQWDVDRYGPMHKAKDVIVPPFLIDDAATRQDLASYYNEVTRFDHYIGAVVAELKSQDELDNTLIFVLADNGRPFPRAKTRIHDSGMKTALVAHWPAGIKTAGRVSDSLVSVIDLAPTVLGVAGLKPTETMQGVSLQPLLIRTDSQVRQYAFSEHNWHDYEAHGRGVRGDGFLLVRNFRPQQAWQGPADSVRSPSHDSLKTKRDAKELTAAQSDVFLAPRPTVELYDLRADPHQLTNLVGRPDYNIQRALLTQVLDAWMEETHDSVPEEISLDSFDRETGDSLKLKSYRRATPGEDREASSTNAPGPR
ncbi:MAG: sulfatase [Planctomycetota bacterium]|nr:sulfatase [Planctomycetota bacterium]MDA1163589.1 sulfatase [Planctomycetota bacterium]